MKIRIAFLIGRLDRGGAERQLIQIAAGLDQKKFDVTVVTCYSGGGFATEMACHDHVKLVTLEKRGRSDLAFVGRALRVFGALKPHIIHGFMNGANELATFLGPLCRARVIWGLRSSNLGVLPLSAGDRLLFRAGAILSRQPDRIIVNSEFGRSFHIARGYDRSRMVVIPNGIDTRFFAISPSQREIVRREWGVRPDEVVIGRAGRFHPVKDFPCFIKAAALASQVSSKLRFACIGDGTDCAELQQIARAEGVHGQIIWAGGRSDMAGVYNALDLAVSTSLSEGFPNTLAESMACGTRCVATDVGDSALIVRNAGAIVSAGDPAAIADGMLTTLRSVERYTRELVRRHITDNFSLDRLLVRTESEMERLVSTEHLAGRELVA